ncbi:MAG TPA: WcbI family polysaccharide biosynthesis putative acetyltransferase [Rhodopila sp.]|uniref:WcbI family polysaccharide biosynthesis putative acetyltransferase n=1 Tax=Rhodopila sp. TaxID=2480087 RepID=UPI002CCA7199|nr:WcbI family polysaccharide biosynthesis putative acetyltransferase [Rhodopila sp.]HVY15872.1 WcbI family polysaccharide biosynthesis putative acetyltransferase [Rhodopila sp.]
MEGVYVFGSLGNMGPALGTGWSVEAEFAWTTGPETALTLALPGDDRAYTVRFDLHPAVFPGSLDSQSLTVAADFKVLATFELSGPGSIAIPLPPRLTKGRQRVRLQLLHPQAARPCDHADSPDTRRLGFCFRLGALTVTAADDTTDEATGGTARALESLHGLIAGGPTAALLTEIMNKLPCLRGRLGVRAVDLNGPLDDGLAALPQGTLETAMFCWFDEHAGWPDQRAALRARLPGTCEALTFQTPYFRCLWPFLATDPRAHPEPGRYEDARYPRGDRLASALASANLTDDVLWLMYEMAAEQEPLDLDTALAKELRRMRQEEASHDVKVMTFIQERFRQERLFLTPYLPNAGLIREIAWQMLDRPRLHPILPRETLAAQLDALLEGFTPWDTELPIHPRVARHFGLAWWRPDMTYRWFNNHRTHRQYTLDQIRWTQWRI